MLSSSTLVKEYRSLSFYSHGTHSRATPRHCSLCQHPSAGHALLRCRERECGAMAHYYCILQSRTGEDGQWADDLRILGNAHTDFLDLAALKAARYLKAAAPSLYKTIFGQKRTAPEESAPISVYCPTHSSSLVNCLCVSVEESRQ
jgi:hypothetical protein